MNYNNSTTFDSLYWTFHTNPPFCFDFWSTSTCRLKKDLLFPSWWFSPTHLKKTCSSQIGSSSPGFGVKIKLLETTMLVSYNTKNSAFRGPFSSFPKRCPSIRLLTVKVQQPKKNPGAKDFWLKIPGFFFHPKTDPKGREKQHKQLDLWLDIFFECLDDFDSMFCSSGCFKHKVAGKKNCM